MRLLLLGGTTEASRLAAALARHADVAATLSLAGRTATPARAPIPVRVGGFGGPEGLAQYLGESRTDVVVDATHPFAAAISANAVAAAEIAGVPLLAYSRPPWVAGPGDSWTEVADIAAAAAYLAGLRSRSVFLTTGRQNVAAFGAAPQHRYLIRTVDPAPMADLPPRTTAVLGRGPFDEGAEHALMQAHGIELIVSKNSGGDASGAKLAAARQLGLPVLMVRRPPVPARAECHALADVLAWIADHAARPR